MSYLSYHEGTSPVGGGAFQSMTEALDPAPTIVPKTHFVEWFSGNALDSIWTFTDVAGTGSGAIVDSSNSGYAISTGTTTNNNSLISFNDIRHYSHNSSVCTALTFSGSASDMYQIVGFTEQESSPSDTRATYKQDTTNTYQVLTTLVNTSSTEVNTSLVLDLFSHISRVELKSSSCVLHVDDTLEAISTSNLPDVAMQPHFRVGTRTTASKDGHIKYMECYNT